MRWALALMRLGRGRRAGPPLLWRPMRDPGPLQLEIRRVKALIQRRLAEQKPGDAERDPVEAAIGAIRAQGRAQQGPEQPPLYRLAERFGLTDRELDVLVATLAPHLDPDISGLLRDLRGGLWSEYVDGAVLLRLFGPTWDEALEVRRAIGPQSALLQARLIQVVALPSGASSLQSAVAIHPRIVHYVLGEEGLSHLVAPFCEVQLPTVGLDAVVLPDEIVRRVLDVLEPQPERARAMSGWGYSSVMASGRGTALLFAGPSGTGKTLFANALACHLRMPLLRVFVGQMLRSEASAEEVLAELAVESQLRGALLLFDDCAPLLASRSAILSALLAFLDSFDGIAIMASNMTENLDLALERRVMVRIDFAVPDAEARLRIFETLLPPGVPIDEDTDLTGLAQSYEFTGGLIKNTIMVALNKAIARSPGNPRLTDEVLREAADVQLRNRLDDYAIVTRGRLRLADIILPDDVRDQIAELLEACRNQRFVLNDWGFAERLVTGRGIVTIFDGLPGTGKTLCAEIIGVELGLAVSRIDIPSVVSKWVGETEQRLQDIFRRARATRTILLFDEADALFGRRVEQTERATDRYANMEVNLLLQEIERYDGIVILTTNLFGALDDAVLRRIQYRVTFPEPDAEARGRIFRTLVPKGAPVDDDVDFPALGKEFDLPGGRIKNSVLRAAYRARQAGAKSIAMAHFRSAATDECKAAGKLVRGAAGTPLPMGRRTPPSATPGPGPTPAPSSAAAGVTTGARAVPPSKGP